MIPVVYPPPDIALTLLMVILSTAGATLFATIVIMLANNWRDGQQTHWAFLRRVSIHMLWQMLLVAIRFVSFADTLSPIRRPIFIALVLISVAVGALNTATSIHFSLIWIDKLKQPRWRALVQTSFGLALLAIGLLIFAPTVMVTEIFVSSARIVSLEFTGIGTLILGLSALLGLVTCIATIRVKKAQGFLFWLSDGLLVIYLISVGLFPQINDSLFAHVFLAAIMGALIVFFFQSPEINLTRWGLDKLRQSLEKTETLNDISHRLMQNQASSDALRSILNLVTKIVPADNVALMIFDDEITEVEQAMTIDESPLPNDQLIYDIDWLKRGLAGKVIDIRQTILSDGDKPDPNEDEDIQQMRADRGVGPVLVVPLLYNQNLVGLVTLSRFLDNPTFSQTDVDWAETIAAQMAGAIANTRSAENNKQALVRSEALRHIGAQITQEGNLETVLDTLLEQVSMAVQADGGVVVLADMGQERVKKVHITGDLIQPDVPTLMTWERLQEGLHGQALRSKVPIFSPKYPADPRESLESQQSRRNRNIGSAVFLPLLSNEKQLGIAVVIRALDRADFNQDEINFLESIAQQASIAVENAALLADREAALQEQARARLQAEIMFEVADAARDETDLDSMLTRFLKNYYLRTGFKWLRLQLLDEDTQTIYKDIKFGINMPLSASVSYAELMQDIPGQAFTTRTPILSLPHESRSSQKNAQPLQQHNVSSVISAPLLYQDQAMGIMSVFNDIDTPAHTQADLDLLAAVANQIASTINSFNATELVRQQEERFRAMMEHASEAITILDVDQDRIIELNDTACELFGYSREYILAADPLEFYPPDQRDRTWRQQVITDVFNDGGANVETQFEHSSGRIFPVEVRLVPLPDTYRRLLRISLFDVTERKRAEAEQLQSQKLESLGVMAGGIAHDFNNLLLAMLGQAQIAQRRLDAGNPAQKNIKKIETAAQRASELTRQMMAYAGRGQTVEQSAVSVNQLITENVTLLRATIPDNVALQMDFDETDPQVFGERGQLQQVVMNMIINASDAIGDHDGAIEIKTERCFVADNELQSWQAFSSDFEGGECVRLTFVDNGIGMEPQTVSRIFDPFFSTKTSGHGLGLAAVLGIIRSHDGSIRVESEYHVGTQFEIVFPSSKTQAAVLAETPDNHLDTNALAGHTILLVDDEVAVLETLQETLQSYDMRVLSATSGLDAVTLFAEHQNNIALTLADVAMPGISGVETMYRLRDIQAQARVILSSGYNRVDADKVAANEEHVYFLQKPYRTEQLLQLMVSILQS